MVKLVNVNSVSSVAATSWDVAQDYYSQTMVGLEARDGG